MTAILDNEDDMYKRDGRRQLPKSSGGFVIELKSTPGMFLSKRPHTCMPRKFGPFAQAQIYSTRGWATRVQDELSVDTIVRETNTFLTGDAL